MMKMSYARRSINKLSSWARNTAAPFKANSERDCDEEITQTADTIGCIDHIDRRYVRGWIKSKSHDRSLVIDIIIDGEAVATNISADHHRADVEKEGFGDGCYGFAYPVPQHKLIQQNKMDIRVSSTGQVVLRKKIKHLLIQAQHEPSGQPERGCPSHVGGEAGSTVPYSSALRYADEKFVDAPIAVEFDARIEELSETKLKGWAVSAEDAASLFEMKVWIDGVLFGNIRNDMQRLDLKSVGKSAGAGGFELELRANRLDPGIHYVDVVLPNGRSLTKSIEINTTRTLESQNLGASRIALSDVAVIVPVYNAVEDLTTCIRRLRSYTPKEVEVVFIDDASTDPRIAALLKCARDYESFKVLENVENLGFTQTINRGLNEIGRKHAVLLNSDARVTPGWIQGIVDAAASNARVATVTPMSDRAGAFSAPTMGNSNPLPAGVDEITFARAFRRRSLSIYPKVPTGNGFCMFVNRACIDEVGFLDAEAFPKGYGEENDFCMRAGRIGWIHLVDDRTYVFHDRSKSFGESKIELVKSGRDVVETRYPEYKKAIQVFSNGADMRWARFRARQALIDCCDSQAHLPAILFVVATQTGGTPQTNMDLMQEMTDEAVPWLLRCDSRTLTLSRVDGGQLVAVKTHQLAEPVDPLSHRSSEYDKVVTEWLAFLNPRLVHIRHLAWHSLSLPAIVKQLGYKSVFSFHDFYTLCPTVQLLDNQHVFCGGTCTHSNGECKVELWPQESLPELKHSWVHVWRRRFEAVLQDVDAYVTTSESARQRILEHLQLDPGSFFVVPHGRNFSKLEQLRQHPRHGEPVRILVPGNISVAKGLDVLKGLLSHDVAGVFEFHVMGTVSEPSLANDYPRLILHGRYNRDDFADRVARIRPHMGAILSIWDETYCHTLTELWSTGVPTVVLDFPTVAGRVRDSGAGWVLPHNDVATLHDSLVELSFDKDEQHRVDVAVRDWQNGTGTGHSANMMAAAYRDIYRYACGAVAPRPRVAVVAPSDKNMTSANASTVIRIWERTLNDPDRPIIYTRMTPSALLANLRAGLVQGAIVQRNVIPQTMVEPLLQEFSRQGVRFLLDLDDDLFDVPPDKDPTGAYAAYAPALDAIVRSAALVTVSTESLRDKLAARMRNIHVLPNRLSERLWRGEIPARRPDGVVRAVYMGGLTHHTDFEMIAPALANVINSDPSFRLTVIGISRDRLPDWVERIEVPESAKDYAKFVPWLKAQSYRFDLGLAPLTVSPFNLFKSPLKLLDMTGLGLPVLASDMPVFKPLAKQLSGVTLVSNSELSWERSLTQQIERVRSGEIDRSDIRATTLKKFGLHETLEEFDELISRELGVPNRVVQ